MARRILSVRLSVCHTRVLWKNGRKICPDFYTIRKNIYPSFLRRRMVGGGRQTDRRTPPVRRLWQQVTLLFCFSFLDSLASHSAFATCVVIFCQRNLALSGASNGACFTPKPWPYARIFDMQVSPFSSYSGYAGTVAGHDSQARTA